MLAKLIAIFVLNIFLLLCSAEAAVPSKSFNPAEVRLICALAAIGSYEDDNAIIARDILESRGWSIEPITIENSKANVKVLMLNRSLADGTPLKVLSICGTSDLSDAEVDLRLSPVPINFISAGSNIRVHQGFQDYTEVMINSDFATKLREELMSSPSEKLYITGHSLGGAVAVLAAAQLVEAGVNRVNPNQIEVITFGAPAVGNADFAEKFKDKFKFQRISMSGDPIKKALAALGYVHFGEMLKYNPSKAMVEKFPHSMALYLDCAIRDYYDAKAADEETFTGTESTSAESIYIAPIQVEAGSFAEEDFPYIKAAIKELLSQRLSLPNGTELEWTEVKGFDNLIAKSLNEVQRRGYQELVVYYLRAEKIREDRDQNYRIVAEAMTYNSAGELGEMRLSSATTTDLTMLEATIFAQGSLFTDQSAQEVSQ